MAACSARLVHIIAESYAFIGRRPVLLDWFTSLLRVTLSRVRGLHGDLFCKTGTQHCCELCCQR